MLGDGEIWEPSVTSGVFYGFVNSAIADGDPAKLGKDELALAQQSRARTAPEPEVTATPDWKWVEDNSPVLPGNRSKRGLRRHGGRVWGAGFPSGIVVVEGFDASGRRRWATRSRVQEGRFEVSAPVPASD